MSGVQSIDVKNLSSRKLWDLVRNTDLPRRHRQLAEQELLLRRRYLEQLGSLHPASDLHWKKRADENRPLTRR